MKKTLMLLVAAICLSCPGQWVITNYVYTVSNITIVTQNEITQNVNRVYNYYSTNFTVNVETNLYIDTMIGTNIATNVTTYETNVNTYIDTWNNVYQTNYTTEVTLTNFEGYVEQCEEVISNGVEYIASMTNDTINEAMLYAYIANESALRLGTTNKVIFSTNSYPYVDYEGVTHPNILCLACNNMNGVIQATPPEGYGGNAAYKIQIGTGNYLGTSVTGVFSEMYIAYANPTDQGMSVIYLPEDKNLRNIGNSQYKYHIDTCFWKTNHLICSISVYNPDGSFRYSYQFGYNWYLWPRNMGVFPPNGHVISSPGGYNEKSIIYLSAIGENSTIYVRSFPSLEQWKYLWWFTHTTGFNFR